MMIDQKERTLSPDRFEPFNPLHPNHSPQLPILVYFKETQTKPEGESISISVSGCKLTT
jgi:hypothetical protein